MNNARSICRTARRGMWYTSVLTAALIAVPALAQDASSDPQQNRAGSSAQAEEDDVIIVTGSRIARKLTDELLPTSTLDAETIDQRGFYNVAEAIIDQPIFSSQSSTDTDFNQSAADVGFTFVDLFGLGSERTLTLVDGKRVVGTSAPQPNRSTGTSGLQVDLNTIPTALIERVETVTIGGAPVYGADAIAGTVNVVLKDRFEGAEFDLQTGITDEGDAGTYRLRGTIGQSFWNDRANVVLAAEYSKRNGLLQTARPGANDVQVSNPLLATDPVTFFTTVPQLPFNTFQVDTAFPGVSAYGTPANPAIAGSFGTAAVLGDNPLGFAENGEGDVLMFNDRGELITVPIGDGNGTYLYTQNQADFPGLHRAQNYVPLLNESERIIVSSLGHVDLTDAIRATYRVNYSRLKARQPVGSPVVLGTPVMPGLAVSIDNPFLSPIARDTLRSANTDVGAAPLPFLFTGDQFVLGKTLAEFGAEGVHARSRNWSAVGGLEGEFDIGGRAYSWDLTYSYGRTQTRNMMTGVNAAAFALATDAVVVDAAGAIITDSMLFAPPDAFTFDTGIGGYRAANGQKIVCRARATGVSGGDSCLPFNPFGAQNPEAVIESLSARSILDTRIEQQFVQSNVSGSPFDLPAGPFQFAAGFEYRHEKGRFAADPLTLSGGLLGVTAGSTDVAGSFTSTEAYAETVIPLVRGDMIGAPFLRSLQFEGSARIIDNSRAGTDFVWTAGGRLELGDLFVIRGNKTRSVRAPGIGQLFTGVAPVLTSVSDPCANLNGGSFPDNRAANCIAAVRAAGLAPTDDAARAFLLGFTGTIGGIPGTVGGNPALENEKADSWTIGLVAEPRIVPGLVFSIDWNRIKLRNAIQSMGGGAILEACYDSAGFPDISVCDQFTRDPATFNLTSFNAGFRNIGFIDFAALTANLQWGFGLGSDAGRIDLRGSLFYLDSFRSSADGITVTEQRNTVGYEKYRLQLGASYTNGGFSALWNANYVPGAYFDAGERDGISNTFEFDKTSAMLTHDVSFVYALRERFKMRFIVKNITEENQAREFRQFASVQARLGRSFVLGTSFSF